MRLAQMQIRPALRYLDATLDRHLDIGVVKDVGA
jgi:hypothetical protein